MIISKTKKQEIEIDLTGPEGNAFVLLGYARQFSNGLGLNYEEIKKEMTSSDYENLVNVFDKHFGGFAILYR